MNILLSPKKWHEQLFQDLRDGTSEDWIWIKEKGEFTVEKLEEIQPRYIFIPHWSHIIPARIHDKFECIVFHMTDLPFGRGGSPLQNLIARGETSTVITAIKVTHGIDTGPIYLKRPLSLYGTAEEIFIRASPVIKQMIDLIIQNQIEPVDQVGEATTFKRRKLEDGSIFNLHTISEIYDYIRMLDAEGYPNAFLDIGKFRFEFSRASLKAGNKIIADVCITEK